MAKKWKCTECDKEIDFGYLCLERSKFLCEKCQIHFNMALCPHDKLGEHQHIRVPGFQGQNVEYSERIDKIMNNAKKGETY